MIIPFSGPLGLLEQVSSNLYPFTYHRYTEFYSVYYQALQEQKLKRVEPSRTSCSFRGTRNTFTNSENASHSDSVMRLRNDYFQQDDQVKFYRASRAVHLVRWAMNRDEEKDNLDTGNSDFPYQLFSQVPAFLQSTYCIL